MNWHSMTIQQVEKELTSSIQTGLTEKEVQKRQQHYGLNVLIERKNSNFFTKFFSQFSDFMIITLIFAAIISFSISFLQGEVDYLDPIIIFIIITLNALLGAFQETKAEHSLEALKKMSAPNACVKRNNILQTIPAKELVPGDIIYLESGNFVPSDARLLTSINLKTEESALTGESFPVEKEADCILSSETLLGDRKNLVLSSSIITYGRGTAIVVATGMQTEIGHIAKLITEDDSPMTPLQQKLAKTSKGLGIAALLICVLLFLIGVLNKRSVFDMFMTSVSLAVAAIPEGLPAIVTIMLSLGVQRMAKRNAVIRHLPAVETLGSSTVICSDKTGTLTQNKMTVTDIYSYQGLEVSSSPFLPFILTLSTLCNNATIQGEGKKQSTTGDPTELALLFAAKKKELSQSKLNGTYKRLYEIPFDSKRKLMTTIHNQTNGKAQVIVKGAPDVLLSHCSFIYEQGHEVPITKTKMQVILKHNTAMAEQALRVIAIAYKNISQIPKQWNDSSLENSLVFVGLIGMIDPPREEAKEAVQICKLAGIKPVMITGDHIITARAIASELHILTSPNQSITGEQLNQMTREQLIEQIPNYTVFARVSPEHKVKIVKAFQEHGEIVAMTGDGANDAPALKAANIGCAMGKNGTDVAKNAADMILTDDNFATIVSAVKEGRNIYDNIRKSIHFLLSSNIGEIITIFIAILFNLPSPLLAVQLLWVNLVTDSLPAITLGLEPPTKSIMKKPPIPSNKGLFSDGLIFKVIFEGALIGLLALCAFIIGLKFCSFGSTSDQSLALGRTMSFAVLSLSQLFHSFNMRSESSLLHIGIFSNPYLILSFFACTFLQVIVISYPPLALLFKVVGLTLNQWIIVFILSALPIVVVEFQKKVNHS